MAEPTADAPSKAIGWTFFFSDDDGTPWAEFCPDRVAITAQVALWMTGDAQGTAEDDLGCDMIAGVVNTLVETGEFHPEGDRPCFLRKAYSAAVAELIEAAGKTKRAYWLARNSAAGLTNYCEESANSRRCERELDEAERIYRESGIDASLARIGGAP